MTEACSSESSSSKFEHFKYIVELGFREKSIFVHSMTPPLFVNYTSTILKKISSEITKHKRAHIVSSIELSMSDSMSLSQFKKVSRKRI